MIWMEILCFFVSFSNWKVFWTPNTHAYAKYLYFYGFENIQCIFKSFFPSFTNKNCFTQSQTCVTCIILFVIERNSITICAPSLCMLHARIYPMNTSAVLNRKKTLSVSIKCEQNEKKIHKKYEATKNGALGRANAFNECMGLCCLFD